MGKVIHLPIVKQRKPTLFLELDDEVYEKSFPNEEHAHAAEQTVLGMIDDIMSPNQNSFALCVYSSAREFIQKQIDLREFIRRLTFYLEQENLPPSA